MTQTVHPEVLNFVNEIRGRFGGATLDDLCGGMVGHEQNCPIARSLSDVAAATVCVTGTDVYFGAEKVAELPFSVAEFIEKFDEYEYPELIL